MTFTYWNKDNHFKQQPLPETYYMYEMQSTINNCDIHLYVDWVLTSFQLLSFGKLRKIDLGYVY